MTVSLAGEVVLTTGGWFDEETLKALNIVLRPLHMKVRGRGAIMMHWVISLRTIDTLLTGAIVRSHARTGSLLWRY